jgi:hypothetical protein
MTNEYSDEYEAGKKEKNVYSKRARDELVENDEISAEEGGFMAGYEADEDKSIKGEEDKDPINSDSDDDEEKKEK